MSDKRSPKDRMEKRRLIIESNMIMANFISTLLRLKLDKSDSQTSRLIVRRAMLQVSSNHDFSGEQWND